MTDCLPSTDVRSNDCVTSERCGIPGRRNAKSTYSIAGARGKTDRSRQIVGLQGTDQKRIAAIRSYLATAEFSPSLSRFTHESKILNDETVARFRKPLNRKHFSDRLTAHSNTWPYQQFSKQGIPELPGEQKKSTLFPKQRRNPRQSPVLKNPILNESAETRGRIVVTVHAFVLLFLFLIFRKYYQWRVQWRMTGGKKYLHAHVKQWSANAFISTAKRNAWFPTKYLIYFSFLRLSKKMGKSLKYFPCNIRIPAFNIFSPKTQIYMPAN